MNTLRSIILILLLLLFAGFVYLHRQTMASWATDVFGENKDAGASQTQPAKTSALVEWKSVDYSADGFKVEMPGTASETQVPAYAQNGDVEEVRMLVSRLDNETTYSLAWKDNPPVSRGSEQARDRILDWARDGALLRTQTSLVSESRINPAGFLGREIVSRNPNGGVLCARFLLTGQRLYALMVAFPSAGARRDQDATRFFNSLTLTSSGTQQTVTQLPATAQ
jgi:hypothetical protein